MHRLIQDHLEEVLAESDPNGYRTRSRPSWPNARNAGKKFRSAPPRGHAPYAPRAPVNDDTLAPRPGFYARVMERIEASAPHRHLAALFRLRLWPPPRRRPPWLWYWFSVSLYLVSSERSAPWRHNHRSTSAHLAFRKQASPIRTPFSSISSLIGSGPVPRRSFTRETDRGACQLAESAHSDHPSASISARRSHRSRVTLEFSHPIKSCIAPACPTSKEAVLQKFRADLNLTAAQTEKISLILDDYRHYRGLVFQSSGMRPSLIAFFSSWVLR